MIRPAALVDVGELQFLDRVSNLLQALRKKRLQILPRRHFQILMTQQKLDRFGQIGASFKQMGCPAGSPRQMGRHCTADAGSHGRFRADAPHGLVGDRLL